MSKLVTLGTPTSTGGKIITASSNMKINGKNVVKLGDVGTCTCGKKSCRGQGKIYRKGVRKMTIDGTELARGGDPIDTGCGTCFVLDPIDVVCLGELNDQNIIIGGNGANIELGDNIFLQDAAAGKAQMSSVTVNQIVPPKPQRRPPENVPEINPNNTYWPPYNFLAKEGEKEIHIRYTQDVVETTVLAPEEWKEFFDAIDKTQNIGGAMKGTYDAFDTAKKLGGLGVTAYVKKHNGVDYLILKGYKQHMKTLLAGNRFKASNPQVVKLGLGSLDSVKGMARYVKVTAPMEILVGSAINVLQFVLNDEYTLRDLGVDEAKVLINALAVAGAGLFFASLAPAFAATVVGGGLILVGASFSVWVIDQFTDFEKKTVNKVLEQFDD